MINLNLSIVYALIYICVCEYCSGQDHIVTQSGVAATPRQGSQQKTSAFMGCGLITKMDLTLQTVIVSTLLMNPRYY